MTDDHDVDDHRPKEVPTVYADRPRSYPDRREAARLCSPGRPRRVLAEDNPRVGGRDPPSHASLPGPRRIEAWPERAAPRTVSIFAQLERPGSRKVVAEEADQDPSTSSMALAYKDPSLQKLRVSMNDPSCGMMAPAATGAVVREYEPLNL
jgi:hypothetical protein